MLRREYPELFIDGQWQEPDSKDRFDVVNPATGEKIGHVPAGNPTDIDRAVEAARKAFYETDWATRPVEERAEMCERLASLIAEHREEFADLITDELGHAKIIADVYHSVAPTLHWNYYAKLGRNFRFAEVREADLTPLAGGAGGAIMKYETKSLVVREPVGVVAVLCAFNFPLPGIAQKTAPALVAGCTAVVKVPDPDPLSLFAMAELINEAGFPPGVINIVAATPEASAHLVGHKDVDMVTFTGSTEVGIKIGEACAAQVKPVVLELGGKSAAIILDDADLDVVVAGIPTASIFNNGQTCYSCTRILAPQSRYNQVVDALASMAAGLNVGNALDPATQIGPMASSGHRDRVLDYIAKGKSEAKLVAGGGTPKAQARGWFVEPTIFANVTNEATIAREEIFGPVLSVIPYKDEADAIRIANDSIYGLGGSVWSKDATRARAVAAQVQTGTIGINGYVPSIGSPFGGVKASGLGRELGPEALGGYQQMKSTYVVG